ncbi:aldehyde dehydrogenase family protein [Pontibacillus yanchengensis]|uniref:Aldehyde dehydrogenase family protein n=1 Tax=Pontibacillus yanchengensis TaxID=462910 RepID=A0ACC7VC65_9BACI|nr:aldehyde dehydrogenase family protein [Pontibacillus yanchengensis]MYL52553.1 aldehyde dehydrogenase family protein [Pontibacillus yanchengensis]
MRNYNQLKHYINGEWVESTGSETEPVINPATEEKLGEISLGTQEDLDKAVSAAKAAFPSFSQTSKEERIEMLERIVEEYEKRKDELIEVMTDELGSPLTVSENVHYKMGRAHFAQAAESLRNFSFTEDRGGHTIVKDTVGVSGLITPWNFPTNQASTKIASAFAVGSPVVLKPAELTPYAAIILTEIFDAAGVPKGAFNLVNGSGSVIGNRISSHPDIDFVSFTGSAGVGQKIMENASETITNVALELGGKSPLVVLEDADLTTAAKSAVNHIAMNSGQVCSAATRILVPSSIKEDFEQEVKNVLPEFPVGDPRGGNYVGPLVAQKQWDRVQSYIEKGIEEGATLLAGGTGEPEGLDTGFYAKPTIFTDVKNDMVIAQEEIFGPVMSIISYDTVDEAIDISNDVFYGLAGYVIGKDRDKVRKVATNIRAGRIGVNNADLDFSAPFGGYKQSGIGREWGDYGIEEYLETKAIMGLPE